MCMLHVFISVFGEYQAPPIGLKYELQRFQSFSVDLCGRKYSWNDAEEDGEKKRLFSPVWTAPQPEVAFIAANWLWLQLDLI